MRFYETKGLVTPARNGGGQRRFLRSDIRRLSFVLIAQEFGFNHRRDRRAPEVPSGRTNADEAGLDPHQPRPSSVISTERLKPSTGCVTGSTAASAAVACHWKAARFTIRKTAPVIAEPARVS
ncbi:MerR family transcriptional regulator [uncultured Roseibium sp.]|uniref:MerR family transcriptional regulator n=1 Tax=uncultured Roseibium sp. TaxID=1936171 RepID=UPI0032177A44